MKMPLDEHWPEWVKALALMEKELVEISFSTWIKPLKPVFLDGDTLYLGATTGMHVNFVGSKYVPVIQNALSQVSGRGYQINVILQAEAEKLQSERESEMSAPLPGISLNPKFTFDAFVTGNSNRFAHAAALAVAEAPGQAYNPLFIYGGSGLGKTHLMHAIGHFVQKQNPNFKTVYVSSERFTNDLIHAIQHRSTETFRSKYRNIDVLLIDDIQFIAGKESTESELFHTFNTLYESQKQIIFSADKHPREMSGLEDRLRSRFEWGLIADIQPPDLETRMAILSKKAEAMDIPEVSYDVLEMIATRSENNIRELEGALTRVIAYHRLSGRDLNAELVQEALKDILDGTTPHMPSQESITRLVCDKFNVSRDDIMSRRRNREVAYPRQIIMYLIRELTDTPLMAIGEYLGGRDHTTVLHGYNTIAKEIGDNNELRMIVADMRKQLQQR